MISRRQADPGGKLPPRSEHLRRRGLHFQQHRADRADAGDLDEPSAAFIGAMPGQELGIDLVDLRLQLCIFLGQSREQLPSQGGQALIDADTLKQRIEMNLSLGSYEAEFACIAADSIAQLGAIADQPVTDADQHKAACCSAVFTGTKRIVGRLIASQSASASAASFLPRLRYGLTS